MNTYQITIFLKEIDELTDDAADRLFEAGCDDGSPGQFEGECFVDFDREADSLEEAIRSATHNVRAAGFSIKRVQMDEAAVA